MLAFAALRPAPAAPTPSASLSGWIWLLVALGAILAIGLVVTSRR
jgi:hypothetical protein